MTHRRLCSLFNFSFIIVLGLSIHSMAYDDKKPLPEGTPVLWQEPTDIATRNLLLGAGGEQMKPDLSRVIFIKEEKGGWSTKYQVRDGADRKWTVKLSKEAQPETVANRLLWAVGYHSEICYLAPSVNIEGKGTFENVRFEARPEEIKRLDGWSWDENPFLGTHELQGLKVLMLLINNWDIKDENNKILYVENKDTGRKELRYIISDLGGSFGKTGNFITRSRNKPSDFVKARFVDEIKGNFVDFKYSGKRGDLFRKITVEDARWIGSLLAKLSDEQIRDAFRAANYSPEQVESLAGALKDRINELVTLQPKQN
jgi:hypothetical protein